MAESNLYIVAPIIISAFALIVSILGYVTSKKQVNIMVRKEYHKEVVRETIDGLRGINDTLKRFSYPIPFNDIDDMANCIVQELREKDNIKLSLKYESLKLSDDVFFIKSLKNSNEFINLISFALRLFYRKNERGSNLYGYHGPDIESSINFTIQPEILCTMSFNLGSIMTNLTKLQCDIDNLTRGQYLIDMYDPELYDLLNEKYDEILNLLYAAFSKQEHVLNLTKTMTLPEVKDILYSTLNYNHITKITTSMSPDLRKRANDLKKELAVYYLTN